MSIERLTDAAARAVVRRAAGATGADFDFLLRTAQRESSLKPQAKAQTSSAAGLFQFVERTWLTLIERYGEKHGVAGAANLKAGPLAPEQRAALLDLRYDPDISAKLAGELARENAAILKAKLGREPEPGELYAAHVLGPAGAARLVRAAEAGAPDASLLFPKAAAANRGLFFDQTGQARSAAALLQRLTGSEAAAPPRAAPPDDVQPSEQSVAAWLVAETLAEADADLQKRAAAAYRKPSSESIR